MDVHRDVGVVNIEARPSFRSQRARTTRRLRGRVADMLLTVGAVFGVACIALVLTALLLGVRIVLFSTGSMAPTIPAESVAMSRAIPAAEVRVGDIVTVARPNALPITHRVVALDEIPDGTDADARRITMRGDANGADDPLPYDVVEVQRVFFWIPFGARFVDSWDSPGVLGGLTVVATAVVVAAFWPRAREEDA